MSVLLGVAIIVALWWALSARRASQAALRYQLHRDALANAQALLTRYSYTERENDSGGWEFHFDVRHAPVELRELLQSSLEGVLGAVKFTNVPRDLGDPERLESLISDLELVRRLEQGEVAGDGLRKLRARFVDRAFEAVEDDLKFLQSFEGGSCRRLSASLRDARVALAWKVDGDAFTHTRAKRIADQAERFLRSASYEIKSARGAQLKVLASEQSPSDIAVNVTHVYWTDDSGTVMRVRKGGGKPKPIASRQSNPHGIALAANYACWTTLEPPDFETGTVVRKLLAGGGGGGVDGVIPLASDLAGSTSIAIEGKYVYYASNEEGTLERIALDDGKRAVLVSGQARPRYVRVDARNLYWVNWGEASWPSLPSRDGSAPFRDSSVMKILLAGGAPIALASGQAKPDCFEVNATCAFWTCSLDGTVSRVSLDGGEPIVLASGQEKPCELTLDATSVFWINDGRAVMKAPLDGGEPVLVASSGPRGPWIHGIVVDETHVYFWDDDGNVMSLAKE